MGNPLESTIHHQGWKSSESLGLDVDQGRIWDNYLGSLRREHIHLSDTKDSLVWMLSADGIYKPKEGYIALCTDRFAIDLKWWWRGIWKVHCPAKSKLLWWSILEKKVPTWDFLQKRSFIGPSRCYLCNNDVETIQRLFLDCGVAQNIWTDILQILNIRMVWHGGTMDEAFSLWWNTVGSKSLRMMSLIVPWGIWIARNECIFKDTRRSILEIIAKVMGLIMLFSDTDALPRHRLCPVVQIV